MRLLSLLSGLTGETRLRQNAGAWRMTRVST